jgi:hypothetical protein
VVALQAVVVEVVVAVVVAVVVEFALHLIAIQIFQQRRRLNNLLINVKPRIRWHLSVTLLRHLLPHIHSKGDIQTQI